METSEYLLTVESVHSEARRRGLFFQQVASTSLRGRKVNVNGRDLVSFASCSYLGLEHHPHLVQGVHEAVDRYGTQFSASRGYLSAPEYAELEALLGRIFAGHVLVTPSTTMGHTAALPVLVTEKDAIVMDHQVHHSVQTAATLARANGARVEVVRHGELDRAEALVRDLARSRRTVWFTCDGVYSMYGDLAPVRLLQRLLAVAPNVRLYVDDAHGMSWAGSNGCGSFLSRMRTSDRVVLATSLNKAFSAAGGCLVFPTLEERERVRMCAGPMVFSGPVQPPMLGAALASARLHLSDEIVGLQAALAERIEHANRGILAADLPLLCESNSPILFLGLGLPQIAFDVAERLRDEGVYVCVSAYPSVPMKRAGIRLTLTAAHSIREIDRVIELLSHHVPKVLEEHGVSDADLDVTFAHALPRESRSITPIPSAGLFAGIDAPASSSRSLRATSSSVDGLVRNVYASIDEIDAPSWDALMADRGLCNHSTMRSLEAVFRNHPAPEHRWGFRYVIVRDAVGKPVLATFFTCALIKDDMLMREDVSRVIETRRARDPYFLTSRAVMMGSLLSEGRHLYLDREGPWRDAVRLALAVAIDEYESSSAGLLMLRDLADDDSEMDSLLFEHGLLKAPMLSSHVLAVDPDPEHYAKSLGRRRRIYLRNNADRALGYRRCVHGPEAPLGPDEIDHLYGLYENVARKSLRLNVFQLPRELLPKLLDDPAWEIVTLRIDPAAGGPSDEKPVAFFAAYHQESVYAGFFCGLDYRFVFSHGAYRQVLHQAVLRSREVGAKELRLGMGADVEKSRFGTVIHGNAVYVQARDDFGGSLLRDVAEEAALAEPA